MQVILLEDVSNLGYKDDVVNVRDGYGRNYLLPQRKAVIASESAKKVLAENLRQRKHKIEQFKNDAQAQVNKLQDVQLVISAKMSETGTIFGSVSSAQICEELAKLGYNIDRKQISLKQPVKEAGEYTATVKLYRDITVDIPFKVTAAE